MDESKELLKGGGLDLEPKSELPDNLTTNKLLTPEVPILGKNPSMDEYIDYLATARALDENGVVVDLVSKKAKELRNKAEAREISAESEKTRADTALTGAQAENISAERKKAIEFFDANKPVFKMMGIRHPLSYKTLQWTYIPALIIYLLFSIMFFPFSIAEFVSVRLIDILGEIFEEIKSKGWQVVCGIVIIIMILSIVGLAYWAVISFIV